MKKHKTNKPAFIIGLLLVFSLLIPIGSCAQKRPSKPHKIESAYRFDQYVFVTLKDGTQVPAKVGSVKSKNEYYVKMIEGGRYGAVKEKYLRAMTEDEIQKLNQKSIGEEPEKEG